MKNKTQLQQTYIRLKTNKSLTPQKRGFEFERLLFQLFMLENLAPASSYRTSGE